jgi:hypothetical protein
MLPDLNFHCYYLEFHTGLGIFWAFFSYLLFFYLSFYIFLLFQLLMLLLGNCLIGFTPKDVTTGIIIP